MSPIRAFAEIRAEALARKGEQGLAEGMQKPKSAKALAAIPDRRWLAEMTRRVFQAGFNWKVIDAKWAGFEAAFEGFDPGRWRLMSDEDLDRLLKDERIVRHAKKIESVRGNAILLCELAEAHGSAAKAFASWPAEDYVGLVELLKKRGARLGGNTGQIVLRSMGVDSFILSGSVTAALIKAGVIDKPAASKGAMKQAQAAFDQWRAESGLSMTEISRVLAMSADG